MRLTRSLTYSILFLSVTLAASITWAHKAGFLVPASSPHLRKIGLETTFRDRPITGLVYSFYDNFRPKIFTVFLNGAPHGPEISWYPSGLRERERHYRKGVPHGLHQSWHDNGKIKSYALYVDGLADGEQWFWHQNGQVTEYNLFDHGREITHKTWTFDGKPFHNYVYQNGEKVGIQGEEFCKLRQRIDP